MKNNIKKFFFPLAPLALIGLLSGCNAGGSSTSSVDSSEDVASSASEVSSETVSSESTLPDSITGSGTEEDPYVIYTASQLAGVAEEYNSQEEAPLAYTYYTLGADIDMTGTSIEPIGTADIPFYGGFDGNGYSISNLKFSTFDKTVTGYGLFGYASDSDIYNLDISVDYSFSPLGAKSYIYVGGLVGEAYNTIIENVNVSGTISLASGQNSSSQLIVGGVAGVLAAGGNYVIDIANCISNVNITCDMVDAADTTNVAGGIVGAISNSSSSSSIGVYSVMSSYFNGSIKAGTAAGGIAGGISIYTSIVDCYAEGTSLETTDTDGGYAGGILGQGYYETAVLHNYASFNSISAASSTSTYYKSYAGSAIGYAYSNLYESDSDLNGTVNYANYAKAVTVTSDKVGVDGTISEGGASAITAAGLSSYWSVKDGKVSLSPLDYSAEEAVNVKLDANYEGGDSQSVTLSTSKGAYDSTFIKGVYAKSFDRDHYCYAGMFYDEAGTQPYCFFAPFVADTTLYASYGDLSKLVGTYDYVCGYATGIWYFDEEHFYWQNKYYETFVYDYVFDGTYIFIGEGGSYEDEIFKLNDDGTITGYDINDSDYQYVGTKSSTAFVIPDYAGKAYLGTWYFSNGNRVVLNADGNASGYNASNTEATGGFTVTSDGALTIQVSARLMASGLTYDETEDVMYSSEYFGARTEVKSTYATSDNKVKVYCTESKNYAIKEGALVSMSGDLSDGSEVTIDGIVYTVSGTSLSEKTVTPSIPEDICGTYVIGTLEMTLNSDGSGTWNDGTNTYNFTFTYDSASKKATLSTVSDWDGDNSITFNDDGSVSVHLEDEYLENVVNKTMTKKSEFEEGGDTTSISSKADLVGTWKDANGNTMVLTDDGKGAWNDGSSTYNFTWTYDESKKTGTITDFGGFDDGENSFSVNDDGTISLSLSGDYGDNVYKPKMTKQAESAPISGKVALIGTWKDTNGNTMVLTDDGKGTWNDGSSTYSFTWTYDESKKTGTLADFGGFDDGENSFSVNDDGTISLSLSGDYGDNVYKPKMTKQA